MTIDSTANRDMMASSLSGRTWAGRLMVWPVCILAMALHLGFAHDDYSVTARAQAGALCCLALLATAFSPVRVLPAIAIGVGYLYLAMGQPVFARGVSFSRNGPVYLPTRALEDATLAGLVYALVAIVVALLTDRLLRRSAWKLTRALDSREEYGPKDTTAAHIIVISSMVLRVGIVIGINLGAMQQPIQLFTSPLFPLTLLFWDAERTERPNALVLFWGATGILTVLGLMTGMLQEALTPGLVAAALTWTRKARLPFGMIAIGAVMLLVLNPAKATYRQLAWFHNNPSFVERVTLWGVALERTYLEGSRTTDISSGVEGATARFGTLGQVAHIFEAVPHRIPHAGPERWLGIGMLAIPRIVWPEKPVLDTYYNRNYTYTFRIQMKKSGGSITVPAVGDGYWRLGWLGVMIEGALLGLLLGASQGMSRGGTRSALLLAGALMQIRTDAHVFGQFVGTLQLALLALIVTLAARYLTDQLVNAGETASI